MANKMRRAVLTGLTGASIAPSFFIAGCAKSTPQSPNDPWLLATSIRARIQLPIIPDSEFVITDFGAKGDGKHDNTGAISRAIAAATKAGGGRVTVPEGTFMTGPIHLQDRIDLHVKKGATLSFIPEPDRYLPAVFTRWEGVEFMGLSPLIYAYGKSDIAVSGQGRLVGGADDTHWWPWKGIKNPTSETNQNSARKQLFIEAEQGVPPEQRDYAKGAYLRPPFIQFYKCNNILIEDVTITASPFWLINPVLSNSITVRGVTCHSYGPNNDGCNPESCNNVLIENCLFDTGDDCIAIKSGRNADGRRINVPSQNIIVANCSMKAGHGGVVMGSELSGGIKNIFVEHCKMSSPDLWSSIRIKTNAMRGGGVTNLNVRHIDIGTVRDMLLINYYYEEGEAGDFTPVVNGLTFDHIHCANAQRILNVRGFKHAQIQNIALNHITIDHAEKPSIVENVSDIRFQNMSVDGKAINSLDDLATETAS
ncbi:glycoside hydrolase family 28 protein [Arenicella xantha]|uniref:Pectate lyase-like protein n=1 Tax=Arenicella xantha TaxID=644221 RepID=A0A395JR29_9GAMM|nr:glycoside hydrolase family 28 protein [Arenicella xantha]RBP53015.1 pectate lyase-like protein [Arenicella xantha]